MDRTQLEPLLREMEWADALVWQSVLSLPPGTADQDLHARLHHIHRVQHVFLRIWSGEPLESSEPSDFADLPALCDWARSFHAEAVPALQALDDSAIERVLDLPWGDRWKQSFGELHPPTLAQTVMQVVFHTAHHRGQVLTRMRELGTEPPLVDFIIWVCRGQPDPTWP